MIPYSRQSIDNSDIKAVVRTLKSNYLTQGSNVEKFEKSNIICSKIIKMKDAINQPQIKHNKSIVEIEKKDIKRKIVGVPVRLSKTPGSVRTFPPKLGENTEEILLSLGYKSQEIETLKNNKVIE